MESKNVRYIARLDHLRVVAVALVIMFHVKLWTLGVAMKHADLVTALIFDEGHIGVPLFMVISGYILTMATRDRKIDVKNFYLNRVLRIYPLYITIVALGYFSVYPNSPVVIENFIFALTPFSNLAPGNYGNYGMALWSIAVELQFYLIFPIVASAVLKHGLRAYFIIIGTCILLRAGIFAGNGTVHKTAFFTIFGCLDSFLLGCIAAQLQARWHLRALSWAWFGLAVIAVASILYGAFSQSSFFHVHYSDIKGSDTSQNPIWIIWPTVLSFGWATVLLAYVNAQPLTRSGAGDWFAGCFAWLGQISYSLYGWHIFVGSVLFHALPISTLTPYLNGLMLCLATIPLAALSYYVIEKPFLELRRPYHRRASATPNFEIASSSTPAVGPDAPGDLQKAPA